MQSRRNFIGKVASGLAGTLAVSNVLGANERNRLGIIGAGDRGMQIVREAMACPNTDFVAFADIYTKRLEDAKKVAPNAKTYLDHRYLLDDKSIDAVLIATPQHLHCEHFTAALDAGKHVYQEKTMAFTVDHAKRMRAAYQRAGKRTVQIGQSGRDTKVDELRHTITMLGSRTAKLEVPLWLPRTRERLRCWQKSLRSPVTLRAYWARPARATDTCTATAMWSRGPSVTWRRW